MKKVKIAAICKVEECNNKVAAKNFCNKHYKRFLKYNNPLKTKKMSGIKYCTYKDCNKKYYGLGYCSMHYERFKKHGDPSFTLLKKYWTTDRGYKIIKDPVSGRWIGEHRVVMQNYIGRQLLPEESVHHINGDRMDNRIENLELWSKKQPYGQRVEDKINFAIEILNMYAPELINYKKNKVS